ncbi:MAG: Methyltransferase protein, partial [Chloroflexi bacterium]|nr:Methyltransferase protein [Chloroflexota bacterium]
AAFQLAEETDGDRGLGPLLTARPGIARAVAIQGQNPDVDTHADLSRLAELAWAERVRANRDQVDRVREAPDAADFYASVSSIFRDDPDRSGDPVLDWLRTMARPDDTWLDIGAGAGRYALPIARGVSRVISVDPSASMLGVLRETMAAHDITNVDVVEGRWPDAATRIQPADVSLIAHVGYDTEAIGPFVVAMEAATRRTCLAILMERTPATLAAPFWPPVHGEERIPLPALPAFVDLLVARGRAPRVEIVEATRRRWGSRDELISFVRKQLWTQPGSQKDRAMLDLVERWAETAADGSIELTVTEPLSIGAVTWEPDPEHGG